MLALAGTYADGTVTWMTGPKTLRRSIVPAICRAAEESGRPQPRIIAGLPVCVTNDPAAARETVRPRIQGASALASYRRALDERAATYVRAAERALSLASFTPQAGRLRPGPRRAPSAPAA